MSGTIDFSIEDLAPTDIEAMLARLDPALNDTAPSDWCVDCRGSRYLGPSAAVLLATTVLERSRRGRPLQVRLPTSPPKLRAFCAFSGLDALVGTGPQPDAAHPKNETAPLHAFTKESFSDSTP